MVLRLPPKKRPKRWQVLDMAGVGRYPGVLEMLEPLADVLSIEPDQRELAARIGEFEAYLASLHVQADRAVLERAKKLRVIATPSTGLDHIDLATAAARKITILSLRGDTESLDHITATAELAWGLLLAVVRRLPWASAAALRGEWARDRFRGRQLSGKTFGVLGYGRLGRMTAQYAKAFRMKVLACDLRDVKPEPGVTMVDFDTLLAQADVLSIHIHLTDENRGLLNAAAFAKIKRGAVLLNTSRGSIIDETAMLEALSSGRLAGAGLDVICGEWDANLARHPLIRYAHEHENLVISPHIGGVTVESQQMAMERTAAKLRAFLEGQHAAQ